MIKHAWTATAAIVTLCAAPGVAAAADKQEVQLAHCETNLGSIAVVDGDTQGWTKYGLGSPRELITAMALKSGCFSLHDAASGKPADFLINAIAGDKQEVDRGVAIAKGAVTEGLVRSGAVGQLASHVPVPMLGSALGMFGGLGGKKKTYAAGLRIISPATGQTLVAGSGEAKQSMLTFSNPATSWYGGVEQTNAAAYTSSKDGQMLSTAFVQAFNAVIAQSPALAAARPKPVAAAPAGYATAVDTKMYGTAKKATVVRTLRAATALTPTGKREGLFVEVKDSAGTTGWVSVEDLK